MVGDGLEGWLSRRLELDGWLGAVCTQGLLSLDCAARYLPWRVVLVYVSGIAEIAKGWLTGTEPNIGEMHSLTP